MATGLAEIVGFFLLVIAAGLIVGAAALVSTALALLAAGVFLMFGGVLVIWFANQAAVKAAGKAAKVSP